MKRLSVLSLLAFAASVFAADSERISLENWRMARMRIGGIVEFETLVRNLSADALRNVAVSAEYFNEKGQTIGRTTENAVDNMGRVEKARRQGRIPALPGRGRASVALRSPQVPAFARYVVAVRYEVDGGPFEEKFEGGQIGSDPPQRVVDRLLGDRLEVRVVSQELIYLAGTRVKQGESSLELRLKNLSTAAATGLKVGLEVKTGNRTVKNAVFPLSPSRLQPGEERDFKLRVGHLPTYDSYRVSLSFDEPPAPRAPTEIHASAAAREVQVEDLKLETDPAQPAISGKVANRTDKAVTNVLVTVELHRGATMVQQVVVDSLFKSIIAPGESAAFTAKPGKLEKYDALQASVECQTLGQ